MPSAHSPDTSRLAYVARYTHRVAISSSRLIGADEQGVTFKYKDYRSEGPERYKTMTVVPGEFIRRFMLHILPKGFHRIRHYGLLARSRTKADTLARARELIELAMPMQKPRPQPDQDQAPAGAEAVDAPVHPCPCRGSPMSSSRCSRLARRHRPRPGPRFPSIRHDGHSHDLTRHCRSIVLLVDGRQRRGSARSSSETIARAAQPPSQART